MSQNEGGGEQILSGKIRPAASASTPPRAGVRDRRLPSGLFVEEGWPFLLAMFAVPMLITYVPSLVVWLPTRLMGP